MQEGPGQKHGREPFVTSSRPQREWDDVWVRAGGALQRVEANYLTPEAGGSDEFRYFRIVPLRQTSRINRVIFVIFDDFDLIEVQKVPASQTDLDEAGLGPRHLHK